MKRPASIAEYADALAHALSFDRALSRRVRQEIEVHLWEAAAAEPTADCDEAQRRAIVRFGDPHTIAAQFAAISLAKRARQSAAIAILTIGGVYALMKARLAWYDATQLMISDDMRMVSSVVARIDSYTFWLSLAVGIGAWAYAGSRRIPARLNPDCRKELRRSFVFCGAATMALIASVIGDAVLTALRVAGSGWSPNFLLPVALMAIEVAGVAALASQVGRAALRTRPGLMR